MGLILKLCNLLFEHDILSLKMNQEKIVLKDAADGLDDKRRGLLEGGTAFHQKGIEKVYSLSLFYP
jgi:hypothetical protein